MLRAGQRFGMTLVELLVTLGIAVVLLAIALPTIKFTLDTSRVREASRTVNTFIAGAKARAATTGQSVGVWFDRDPGNHNICNKLYLTEVPKVYGGDQLFSRICVRSTGMGGVDLSASFGGVATYGLYELCDPKHIADPTNYPKQLPPDTANMKPNYYSGNDSLIVDPPATPVIADGARFEIRFDFKGPWYPGYRSGQRLFLITEATAAASAGNDLFNRGGVPPLGSQGSQYEIRLLPRRLDSASIDLPRGTAIDLSLSGEPLKDSMGKFTRMSFAGTTSAMPVVVMFTPSGRVDRLYYDDTPQAVLGTLHFLVGRIEKIPSSPIATTNYYAATENLYDGESLWVSIGHRSGTITTVENNISDPVNGQRNTYLPFDSAIPMGRQDAIAVARYLASTHQAKGGQ
jgi:prepilin-type N-terminal cleavage/methylation domain-containing protein